MRPCLRTVPRLLILTTVAAACSDDLPTQATPADPTTAEAAAASDPTPSTLSLTRIGGFDGGGEGAAEITAFDDVSRRLFVVNGILGTVDVLDLSQPASPVRIATIDVSSFGASANSVAAHGGVVAVAVEAHDKTAPGTVALYRATTLQTISSVPVGVLPDMVAFSPDGRTLLVANEGEPNADYSVDPEGSVSVVDVSNVNRPTVRTAGFHGFDADELRARGVRIYGPNDPSPAQDLEPEAVAFSEDGLTGYATLQENNALALIDVASATIMDVVPFGYKDHSWPGQGLDPSDRDGAAQIATWPVWGMYQPDVVAAYSAHGRTYLVTANEGDARDYDGFSEEARVKDLVLAPSLLARCGADCQDDDRLGRLTVTTGLGQNESGEFEHLFAFGGRSISIWTADGDHVWDSGDDLESRTASLVPGIFNASNEDPAEFDNRSDNKGPEPEGLVLGKLGSKTFAFVGLERVGGIMVYDITNPWSPTYVTYVNTRLTHGDLAPEGLVFVPARRSPDREPLLIVGNEVSGTTAVFRVNLH